MSITATLLADTPMALYFPVNFGNLQIGPLEKATPETGTGIWHLSQKWNGAIQRGFCVTRNSTGGSAPCPQPIT